MDKEYHTKDARRRFRCTQNAKYAGSSLFGGVTQYWDHLVRPRWCIGVYTLHCILRSGSVVTTWKGFTYRWDEIGDDDAIRVFGIKVDGLTPTCSGSRANGILLSSMPCLWLRSPCVSLFLCTRTRRRAANNVVRALQYCRSVPISRSLKTNISVNLFG